MLEVELRRVPEGADDYVTVARLRVDEGGQTETWDPEGFLPLDVPALVVDAGKIRRVAWQDDPATYARNLRSILRTGYLVPVVTRDDELEP